MEAKKKNTKVLRCSFTKAANYLDKLLDSEQSIEGDIEILWEYLRENFENLHRCAGEVYEEMLKDATEEQLVPEMETQDAYLKRYTELRIRCTRLLNKVHADDAGLVISGQSVPMLQESGKRKFKLPQIEFKRYDGNIRDWLPFWAQFNKIHEDLDIDNSDKIEYLIQATIPGKLACLTRQLVESFPVRAQNYQNIVNCFKARFGREDLQIEVYVRELLKLVLNNAINQNKLDIYMIYDQIETQLRALDTLGITSDKYAAMLFPLIESSLPQDFLRIWQRSSFSSSSASIGSSQSLNGDSTLEIKLKNHMKILQAEVENEQRISLASEGFGLTENMSHLNLKSNSQPFNKKVLQTEFKNTHFTATDLLNADVEKCIFCTGFHGSEACIKAQKMSIDERKCMLSEKRACFRCLKVGHQASKCRTRVRCIICEDSHIPLMCPNLSTHKQSSKSQDTQDETRDQVLTNQTSTHVFLQTLQVVLKGTPGSRVVLLT